AAVRQRRPARLSHVIQKSGLEFEHMTVHVDDGMAQALAHFGGRGGHGHGFWSALVRHPSMTAASGGMYRGAVSVKCVPPMEWYSIPCATKSSQPRVAGRGCDGCSSLDWRSTARPS